MNKGERNYENIEKRLFNGVGYYEIPRIHGITEYDPCNWIPFNRAKTIRKDRDSMGIHFYKDDYQFIRVWNYINNQVAMFQQFKYICSPDFSLFIDFPIAMQIYNHYRKHWVGAYCEEHGISVIPTIAWGLEQSYDFCFDGEPVESIVSVSTIGCMGNSWKLGLFLDGFQEMKKRLKPKGIILHGDIPSDIKNDSLIIENVEGRCF